MAMSGTPRRRRVMVRLMLDVVLERVRQYDSKGPGKVPDEVVYEYELKNREDLERTIKQYTLASIEYNERITTRDLNTHGGVMLPFPEIFRRPKDKESEG